MRRQRNTVLGDYAAKPIFATGWFKSHGIGYLDMVLAALEGSRILDGMRDEEPLSRAKLVLNEADQYELARGVGYFHDNDGPRLSVWSGIHYLVPKASLHVNNGKPEELIANGKWDRVVASVAASRVEWPGWRDAFEQFRLELRKGREFPDLEWFETTWQDGGTVAMRSLWHVINDAPVAVQVEWYKKYSPLFAVNSKLIRLVELSAEDIDDPVKVTQSMYQWLEGEAAGRPCVLNLWGTTTAIQFGWYYLAWRRPALKGAVFLKCKTRAPKKTKRFVPIEIEVVPSDPIAALRKLPESRRWESASRQNAFDRLSFGLEQGDNFCILMLGPRGTGKSRSAAEAWSELYPDRPMVVANCANFPTPEHARSELFGHEPGAYTGARKKRKGLLKGADNGMLFLDEVHRLDDATAGMLLTALQTDRDGYFSFRPLGAEKDEKSRFQPVFASNRSLCELRKHLGEDFVDRISQRIIKLPAIDTNERQAAWRQVWNEMEFAGAAQDPSEAEQGFLPWLESQDLDGSFRDLQHIAILVADFQRYSAQSRQRTPLGPENQTLLDWLHREMGFRRPPMEPPTISVPFDVTDRTRTEDDYLTECKHAFALAMREHYGSSKSAVNDLRDRNSRMNEGTFCRWLNRQAKR